MINGGLNNASKFIEVNIPIICGASHVMTAILRCGRSGYTI